MAKPKYTRRARGTKMDAIRLHAEANKSDPFASRRMAMTLAKHPGEIRDVAEESKRIIDARIAAVKRAYADWIKTPEGVAMREFLRSQQPALAA
jgi:hypothetical protein